MPERGQEFSTRALNDRYVALFLEPRCLGPRRHYCKLTGDGTRLPIWRYLELSILTEPLMASRRRRYDCKSLQAQNFTHPTSCPVQDRACSDRQTDRT